MSSNAQYKFEPNILKLSKTKDPRELHKEWRYIQFHKKTKIELPSRCICQHDMRNVFYYFNSITQRVIAVGSTCANKLKQLIKGKGSPKSVIWFTNLEPGTYSEIQNVDEYSDECHAEACALLRVEIGRCDESQLRAFLNDPESLLNDVGLIAYARERLAELIQKREKEEARYALYLAQMKERLEQERISKEAELCRAEAEVAAMYQWERRREEVAEKARIEALRRDEEDDEIAQMKFRWDWRDRVIQTEEELLLKEEFQDAERSKLHFKTWGRVLKSLELIEEQQLAKIALEKQLEEERESRERYIRDGAERAKAAQIVFARQLQESREKQAREEAKRRESTEKFKTLMKKLKK